MPVGDEVDRVDPVAALAAFARAAYSDLVTVVLLSVLFSLCALPVVTLGGALVALVETATGAVRGEATGEAVSERHRVRAFLTATRANVRRGLPLSALVVAVGLSTGVYLTVASVTRSAAFLLGALVGLYAVVVAVVWSLRAATLVVRAPPDRPLSMLRALREAAYHLLETPSFTVLHMVFVAVLCALCVAVQIGVVVLLPGLLALAEIVAFEETSGDGALRVVRAYRGELT